MQVIVIGGGIAGLATGWRVQRAAASESLDVNVTVLECEDMPGGKVLTSVDDGWVFEGGPAGFLDNEPATLRLVKDLGLDGRLLSSRDAARRRFIVRKNRLREIHTHPLKFMTSSLLSLRGRLRMVGEMWKPARRDGGEESVADFGRRRLGKEFTEVMLDSMVSGIHAGDPETLSVQAAFPKVARLEERYGGLLRGMRALKKERAGKVEAGPGGVLHSFVSGMAEPVQTLAERLGPCVRTGTTAGRIVRADDRYRVSVTGSDGEESLDADALVLATPAFASSRVLVDLAPDAADALAGVPFSGVHVVCLGYARDQVAHPLEGFGALVPGREKSRILGTLWSSSTFDGHAPDDHVQLRTLLGGARNDWADDLDDAALVTVAREETEPLYGISGDPVKVQLFRWRQGIPQYVLGHLDRMARVKRDLERHPGVFVTGNSVCGVSFNHCVADSERVAEQVVSHLSGHAGG